MDDIRPRIPQRPVRFLDQLRMRVRQSGLACQTEQTYIHCVKQFINRGGKGVMSPADSLAILNK